MVNITPLPPSLGDGDSGWEISKFLVSTALSLLLELFTSFQKLLFMSIRQYQTRTECPQTPRGVKGSLPRPPSEGIAEIPFSPQPITNSQRELMWVDHSRILLSSSWYLPWPTDPLGQPSWAGRQRGMDGTDECLEFQWEQRLVQLFSILVTSLPRRHLEIS